MYFISMILNLVQILVLIRVVLSWVRPSGYSSFTRIVYELTEPLLRPIRQVLPAAGQIDFSPLVLFLIIGVIRSFLRI